jgi:hypothetical protein
VLEKYKGVVLISKIQVDEKDESILHIEFDHDIEAPQNEVAEEVGRVILDKLSEYVDTLDCEIKTGE